MLSAVKNKLEILRSNSVALSAVHCSLSTTLLLAYCVSTTYQDVLKNMPFEGKKDMILQTASSTNSYIRF